MIEKAIVHKDGQITFVFQNGTEIKVGNSTQIDKNEKNRYNTYTPNGMEVNI